MLRFVREYQPDLVFVGLCGDEGRQRRMSYIAKGDALYWAKSEGVWKAVPLIWWTREDVWWYHDSNNIPRNPVYAKYGIERTGCIACTGHIGWRKQLARISLPLYRRVSRDMGQALITDYEE